MHTFDGVGFGHTHGHITTDILGKRHGRGAAGVQTLRRDRNNRNACYVRSIVAARRGSGRAGYNRLLPSFEPVRLFRIPFIRRARLLSGQGKYAAYGAYGNFRTAYKGGLRGAFFLFIPRQSARGGRFHAACRNDKRGHLDGNRAFVVYAPPPKASAFHHSVRAREKYSPFHRSPYAYGNRAAPFPACRKHSRRAYSSRRKRERNRALRRVLGLCGNYHKSSRVRNVRARRVERSADFSSRGKRGYCGGKEKNVQGALHNLRGVRAAGDSRLLHRAAYDKAHIRLVAGRREGAFDGADKNNGGIVGNGLAGSDLVGLPDRARLSRQKHDNAVDDGDFARGTDGGAHIFHADVDKRRGLVGKLRVFGCNDYEFLLYYQRGQKQSAR